MFIGSINIKKDYPKRLRKIKILNLLILNLKYPYVPRPPYKHGVYRVPQPELPDQKEQKEHSQAFGTAKILQILQKENFAQRNEIVT